MNYDKMTPSYYENRYDLIPREVYMKEHWRPLIEKEIEKYCKDKSVLDLGCGTGIYTTVINKYALRVYGIDITKNWITYIRNKRGISSIIMADAHKIPIKNETVNIIVTTGLFEYINREIVIKEMNRILTSEGFCIIFVPNKYSLFRLVTKTIHKILGKEYNPNEPSKKEMMRLFKANKFELIEYVMNDGLIWLPSLLDIFVGKMMYSFIEKFTGIFGENPFSNLMLFIVKKEENI